MVEKGQTIPGAQQLSDANGTNPRCRQYPGAFRDYYGGDLIAFAKFL